jgi:hypothetical protein
MKIHALFCLLGILSAAAAQAQYVWVDAAGQRHYSDRPPGADVPLNRILRSPGPSAAIVAETAKAAAEAGASATAADAPPTTAQRNADFNKRRAEQDDAARKAQEANRRSAELQETCTRMRNYEKSLAAGERVALPNQAGERTYLNDEQRARELREVRGQMAACKNG